MTNGDYPSTDFEIVDDGATRKVLHLPTGMVLETGRLRADPVAVSTAYTLAHGAGVTRPAEIVQAALRHLRVWLMRNHGARFASRRESEELARYRTEVRRAGPC